MQRPFREALSAPAALLLGARAAFLRATDAWMLADEAQNNPNKGPAAAFTAFTGAATGTGTHAYATPTRAESHALLR